MVDLTCDWNPNIRAKVLGVSERVDSPHAVPANTKANETVKARANFFMRKRYDRTLNYSLTLAD